MHDQYIVMNHLVWSGEGLCAQSTRFGYVIFGTVDTTTKKNDNNVTGEIKFEQTRITTIRRISSMLLGSRRSERQSEKFLQITQIVNSTNHGYTRKS